MPRNHRESHSLIDEPRTALTYVAVGLIAFISICVLLPTGLSTCLNHHSADVCRYALER